jgi:hypothetical protein
LHDDGDMQRLGEHVQINNQINYANGAWSWLPGTIAVSLYAVLVIAPAIDEQCNASQMRS